MRYTFFDGLRGFAALAVAIYHLSQYSGVTVFKGAGYAVDIFFCLSGFVLARAYGDRIRNGLDVSRFFLIRFVRLYPVYLLGFLLGAFALTLKTWSGLTDFKWIDAFRAVALNGIFLPSFSQSCVKIGDGTVCGAIFPTNDPAWSLFFELSVGVLYAGLLRIAGLRGLKYGSVAAAVALVLWIGVGGRGNPGWGEDSFIGGAARVIYAFFVGAIVYSLPRPSPKIFRHFPIMIFALAPLCFSQSRPVWLFCCLFVAPLAVWLGASVQVGKGWDQLYHLLGGMSYPLYCLHFPVYSIVEVVFDLYPVLEGLLALVVSLLLSWAVSRFYEKKARSYCESLFKISPGR